MVGIFDYILFRFGVMTMKKYLVFLAILEFSVPALACDDFVAYHQNDGDVYPWGSEVDVASHGDISFYFSTSKDVGMFNVAVEEYGSFECTFDVSKVSESCLAVSVDWSPGSDFSGCSLKLTDDSGANLGTSTLFMVY